MARDAVLVSGADSKFFPLLRELIASLGVHPATRDLPLALFDFGLTPDQRESLAAHAETIARPALPDWVPRAVQGNATGIVSVARLCLPDQFPGFGTYLWLDADIWVQDARGVELYLEAARDGAIAVTPQLDRAYVHHESAFRWRFTRYARCFGDRLAQGLVRVPQLNAGAVALERDAPHWAAWRDSLREAFANASDLDPGNQIPLNHAVYVKDLPIHLLPAICNWQCHLALPRWDEGGARFCEPFLPHQHIYLMHLTADTKDRRHQVLTLAGESREMSLRYPGPAGGRRAAV